MVYDACLEIRKWNTDEVKFKKAEEWKVKLKNPYLDLDPI